MSSSTHQEKAEITLTQSEGDEPWAKEAAEGLNTNLPTDADGFVTEASSLPKGYYYSPKFVGTVLSGSGNLAVGVGFCAGQASFAYVAPILSTINQDIGPDPNVQWVALVHQAAWILIIDVLQTIIGRLTDIFGRRWFLISGGILATLASIISALSVSVPMLIVGTFLKSLAAATELFCFYVRGELVPMKYRFYTNALLYTFQIPGGGMAPAIAQSMILRYSIGWRAVFWLLAAINGTSVLLWTTFHSSKWQREECSKPERTGGSPFR